jgi:hypothetical protein
VSDEERIDPSLGKLFREEPIPQPPPEAQARVLARLEAALPAPHPITHAALAKGLAVFVLGAIAGGTGVAVLRPPPPERLVYVDRPAPPPVPSATLPVPAATSAAPAPRPSAEPRPSAPRANGVSEERSLLDDARQRLAAGDADLALKRVAEHERRFPNGVLLEEREALAIQALVNAGRYDEARARAEAFRKRSPNSVFLPAIDTTLRSIP